MKPPQAGEDERVLTGWKAIAGDCGASVKTVQRAADRLRRGEMDPLPVWEYCGSVIAYPTALRDWRGRQKMGWQKSREVKSRVVGDASRRDKVRLRPR